jgi:pyruvate formate lyase activating enzyme
MRQGGESLPSGTPVPDAATATAAVPGAADRGTSPVYGYMKNPSMVDYPGALAAVMFTTGCNFTCGFCHNANLMGTKRPGLEWCKLAEACRTFREQWVKAACLTGGEPTLWEGQLVQTIHFLKREGFKVKLDTNGSRPDVLPLVLPLLDYVAMDVKCAPASYPAFAGFDDYGRIAESVDAIRSADIAHEFRTTIVESFHDDGEMLAVRELVDGAACYVLQPFIPREDLPGRKYRTTPRTSRERMEEIAALMAGCADRIEIRGN